MQEHKIQYADEELRSFIIDPHKQTIVDLEHFVQELKDKGHHVLIFKDSNEDDQHQFQEQGHYVQLVTKNGFHVDG
jgi:predicted AAA+ superfamily ATPase